MRVAFLWSEISGYMAACWRALASQGNVDVQVIAFEPVNSARAKAPFDVGVMRGIPNQLLAPGQRDDAELIKSVVERHRPEVVVVSGWSHPAYRAVLEKGLSGRPRVIMAMDTPWQQTWRQRIGRVALRGYFRRMSGVIVPGERGWQYARYLGFEEAQIRRGLYGIDYTALSPLYERRLEENGAEARDSIPSWPSRFLFIGRYAPEKGLDVLLAAYRRYKEQVADPWPLTCCGVGPLRDRICGELGVEDLGFVQPAKMHDVMVRHGALVLASRFDPWPLVVAEACAAGLPVVCTDACGSAVELVRDGYNGFTAATADIRAFAAALVSAHHRRADLPAMGRRARQFAAAYSAEVWAERWALLLRGPP